MAREADYSSQELRLRKNHALRFSSPLFPAAQGHWSTLPKIGQYLHQNGGERALGSYPPLKDLLGSIPHFAPPYGQSP